MFISIRTSSGSTTQKFASDELAKYLKRMMPDVQVDEGGLAADNVIRLGHFEDFGLDMIGLANREYDDAFILNIKGMSGFIAGSNDRSILFGLYRFLEQAGCHWARHGADGEYVPMKDISDLEVKIEDRASYRHRGLCIEGAVSIENMFDNIDWALKAGFNSYFLEFFTPYTFFERYYSHKNNKHKEPEPLSVETVKEWTRQLEGEIKKRGLLYHAVGHAWTCEALGFEGLDWDPKEYALTDEVRILLAQVNGKRDIWNGVPINTNLCYSNPVARKLVVRSISDYLHKHGYIDFLHVWLADSSNNHCECVNCAAILPSDFYVTLLNEIEAELARIGNKTKIVFLAYEDLLWAPEKQKFTNPDRFLFLFAPITRTYSKTYDCNTADIALPPYNRNHLILPKTISENIAYMDQWKEMFTGDSLAYEYYFMWDHLNDPGYYGMADVLSQDIKNMRKIRLNGFISDQCQRSFFPTGFPMYVMGKTLWNENASLDDLAKEYFTKTFGKDGDICRRYMRNISELFDLEYMRGEKVSENNKESNVFNLWNVADTEKGIDPEICNRLAQIPKVVKEFMPIIQKNVENSSGPLCASWKFLVYHGDIVTALSLALLELETGTIEKARALWNNVVELVSNYEDDLQSVFDVFEYVEVLGRRFK